MHDIRNDFIRLAQQQVAQGHRSHQLSSAVQHIADIYSLTVHADFPDPGYGFVHSQIFLEIHIFHRHYASGGILRISEKVIDIPPCLRAGVCQDFLYYIGRHLFHKIGRIIRHQVIHDSRGIPF